MSQIVAAWKALKPLGKVLVIAALGVAAYVVFKAVKREGFSADAYSSIQGTATCAHPTYGDLQKTTLLDDDASKKTADGTATAAAAATVTDIVEKRPQMAEAQDLALVAAKPEPPAALEGGASIAATPPPAAGEAKPSAAPGMESYAAYDKAFGV